MSLYPSLITTVELLQYAYIQHCEVLTVANCFKTDSMMHYYLLHIYYPIIQYNILHSALS